MIYLDMNRPTVRRYDRDDIRQSRGDIMSEVRVSINNLGLARPGEPGQGRGRGRGSRGATRAIPNVPYHRGRGRGSRVSGQRHDSVGANSREQAQVCRPPRSAPNSLSEAANTINAGEPPANSIPARVTSVVSMGRLRELTTCNPLEVLLALTSDGSFYARLNCPLEEQLRTNRHRDSLEPCLILHVIHLALECNIGQFRCSAIELATALSESIFLRSTIHRQLTVDWIFDVMRSANRAAVRLNLQRLSKVMFDVVQCAPHLMGKVKGTLVALSSSVDEIRKEFPDVSDASIEDWCKRLHEISEEWKSQMRKRMGGDVGGGDDGGCAKNYKQSALDVEDGLTPPQDFRQLSIIPRKEDIICDEIPFVRANKVKGSYRDVDHYLDVQFRLLREDFIQPIRKGVSAYIRNRGQNDRELAQDIRIYRNAEIGSLEINKYGEIVHRVQFDVRPFGRVRWEASKRLLFGSLLCLSVDRFETMWFAVVVDRNPKDLKIGIIGLSFGDQALDLSNSVGPNDRFVIAESSAYFEAYRPVLKGLQAFSANSVPFTRYLVEGQVDIKPPQYMTTSYTKRCMDFSGLLPSNPVPTTPKTYDVLDLEKWPSAEDLKLDESQYGALQQALTNELAIIQGPPGTGKTFLGYKIAQLLLQNYSNWNDLRQSSPLLVVCYTNHALDQFLEGITRFTTEGIVRVGGRCKSEAMEPFLLKNVRRARIQSRNLPKAISYSQWHVSKESGLHRAKLERMTIEEEAVCSNIMLAVNLEPLMSRAHWDDLFGFLERHNASIGHWSKDDLLQKWLVDLVYINPAEVQRYTGNAAGAFYDAALNSSWTDDQPSTGLEQLSISESPLVDPNTQDAKPDAANAVVVEATDGDVDTTSEENQVLDEDPLAEQAEMAAKDVRRERAAIEFRLVQKLEERNIGESEWNVVGRNGKIAANKSKQIAKQIQRGRRMSEQEASSSCRLWTLDGETRWALYRTWVHKFLRELNERRKESWARYQDCLKKLEEIRSLSDFYILQDSKVIAMTTTGAAKNQGVLQLVKPKIVIIEEAAEVLEAHILTSLSSACQHLILIGDHKQLRPKASVFELARRCNLEISLFERLIGNGFRHATLGLQHRMRPEIADTLMPHFYDGLRNASSVERYESVKGVTKNMLFIRHDHLESEEGDIRSHKNVYEAEYCVEMCRYLIQQGYEPNQITILTPYTGQMFHLRKLLKEKGDDLLATVHVTPVDNFQGEENDIILLSLVRSNTARKIGFVSTKNRVCVALSRARMGLYAIGNFDLFEEISEHWKEILDSLRRQDALVSELVLSCQIHGTMNRICQPPDFRKLVPEGGCTVPCNFRLECGHVCKRLCHPYDAEHKLIRCMERCVRKCPAEGHECGRMCHECQPTCKPCRFMVTKLLPCGHEAVIQCDQGVADARCLEPCSYTLDCGHLCAARCFEPHTTFCKMVVSKTRSCGHAINVACHKSPEWIACETVMEKTWPGCGHRLSVACRLSVNEQPCPAPCDRILKCEHLCTRGTCGTCLRGRVHVRCANACGRTLVCGHACTGDCCKACPPCDRICENKCSHSSCSLISDGSKNKKKATIAGLVRKCGQPCPPCMEPCRWTCDHLSCDLLCSEPCVRDRCNAPCSKNMRCGHPCPGVCGEPCPTNICKTCDAGSIDDKVSIAFGFEDEEEAKFIALVDCGHVFEVGGLDYWMDQTSTTNTDDSHSSNAGNATLEAGERENTEILEIEMKACPLCKVPVRNTARYGAVTKQKLRDIEAVKERMRGQTVERLEIKRTGLVARLCERDAEIGEISGMAPRLCQLLRERLIEPDKKMLSEDYLVGLENILEFSWRVKGIWKDYAGQKADWASALKNSAGNLDDKNWRQVSADWMGMVSNHRVRSRISGLPGNTTGLSSSSSSVWIKRVFEHLLLEIQYLIGWMVDNLALISSDRLEEMNFEIRRVRVLVEIGGFFVKNVARDRDLQEEHVSILRQVLTTLYGEHSVDAAKEATIVDCLKLLAQAYPDSGLGISDAERTMILKAVGLSRGHWYKCPKGHVYAIGECGGANQGGKCPQCGSAIGGQSHRLAEGNTVATEMDGATRSAWS